MTCRGTSLDFAISAEPPFGFYRSSVLVTGLMPDANGRGRRILMSKRLRPSYSCNGASPHSQFGITKAYDRLVRLRRRLNTVLLQWFSLLIVITGTVWVLSLPGIRRNFVDERLLLARSVAHGLDTSISTAIQALGRLAADLPEDAESMPARLHAFRFQSPFSEATYVLDDHAQMSPPTRPAGAPLTIEDRIQKAVRPSCGKAGVTRNTGAAPSFSPSAQGRGLYKGGVSR